MSNTTSWDNRDKGKKLGQIGFHLIKQVFKNAFLYDSFKDNRGIYARVIEYLKGQRIVLLSRTVPLWHNYLLSTEYEVLEYAATNKYPVVYVMCPEDEITFQAFNPGKILNGNYYQNIRYNLVYVNYPFDIGVEWMPLLLRGNTYSEFIKDKALAIQ